MAEKELFDAIWKVECGLEALEGIEGLLGSIYQTDQDLHCLMPNQLATLIQIVRKEIETGFKEMPR